MAGVRDLMAEAKDVNSEQRFPVLTPNLKVRLLDHSFAHIYKDGLLFVIIGECCHMRSSSAPMLFIGANIWGHEDKCCYPLLSILPSPRSLCPKMQLQYGQ